MAETILRDYQHAKKLLIDGNYRLLPKSSYLYYVCLNTVGGASILGGSGNSSLTLTEQYEAGVLAKRVDLPKFSLGNKVINNYNKKEIIHTNISYEPITITFHDDSTDLLLKFWNDYYTHYYRDSDYQSYQINEKYVERQNFKWGFNPRNSTEDPYLRDIQIYSLHGRRFTEYKLINPHITSWSQSPHDSSTNNGIMDVTMTISYETVKYKTGRINPVDVNGFATLAYDNTKSPIGGNEFGFQGDVIDILNGTTEDLARPDGSTSGGGIIDTISNARNLFNTVKNANLGSLAKITIGQMGASILKQTIEGGGASSFPGSGFPSIGALGGVAGVSGELNKVINSGVDGVSNGVTKVIQGVADFSSDVFGDISKKLNDISSLITVGGGGGLLSQSPWDNPTFGVNPDLTLDDYLEADKINSESGIEDGITPEQVASNRKLNEGLTNFFGIPPGSTPPEPYDPYGNG